MELRSLQLVGIGWSNTDLAPSLRFKNLAAKEIEEQKVKTDISVGQTFVLNVSKERRCTGTFGELCPTSALLDSAHKQCFNCSRAEGKVIMPVSVLNEEERNFLKGEPHFNYLVIFGGGIVKTGVAHEQRKFSRLLEQGGVANFYFASCDGLAARQIEDFVSKKFKIPQVVTWNNKLKNCLEIPSQDELKSSLSEIYDEILKGSSIVELFNPPEFFYGYDKYRFDIDASVDSFNFIKNILGGEILSGKIVGIYGKVLFYRDIINQLCAINLGDLAGYIVDFEFVDAPVAQSVSEMKPFKLERKVENLTLF